MNSGLRNSNSNSNRNSNGNNWNSRQQQYLSTKRQSEGGHLKPSLFLCEPVKR